MNSSNSTDTTNNTTLLGATYTVISVCVILANGLIIYVIAKTEELHINALWMLTVRAITDFSYGFYFLVFVAPSALKQRFAYPESLIWFLFCIISLLNGQTIFNVALTVIDRCIAVIKPLAYAQIVTKRNFIWAVIFSFVVSFIRLFMILFPDVDYYYNADIAICVVDFDTRMNAIASVGIPIITFIIIVITSCVIAIEMRRGRRRIQPSGNNSQDEGLAKFGLMVMITVAVFCLCYSPMVLSVVWNLVDKIENVPVIMLQTTIVGMLSNSFFNVFIYTATYRPFREALMRRFCTNCYREQRRNDTLA